MNIKLGTDFSGIGAPEQALEKLGMEYKSVFACDINKHAKKSFLANYITENWYDDITTRDHSKTPYCDLYVAGFPCQAFSVAGKREGFNDPRGTLFFDLFQYIKLKRPKYFILENVKGLVRHDKGNTFEVIMDSLESLNYTIYHKVLNTKNYGIPQNRERIFIVGFRDSHNFEWPETKITEPIEKFLDVRVDDIYYLTKDQINKLNQCNKKNNKKIDFTFKDFITYIKNGVQWVADVRGDEGLRIRKNRLSPCLTASSVPIIKRRKIRRLTPTECLRLQGFPEGFKCVVSDSQLYKQAGNSMTVDVMTAIIKQVVESEN
jgi:DNA (cytosine-5)-methyltransferase 1